MKENTGKLTWETEFRLLSNPNIVKAWVKAMGLTYLVCCVVLVPIFAGTGQWDAIPVILMIFFLTTIGLTLAGFVIMLLILGNRSRAGFSISDQGVSYRSLDKKAGTLSRMAVMAGTLFGSPQAAGAGILSVTNEKIQLSWAGIANARYDEKHLTICLENEYRELLHLYCTPDNFTQVRDRVRHCLKTHSPKQIPSQKTGAAQGRLGSRRNFIYAVKQTGLAILACLPLYALTDILDLDLMLPILISAFSLATVWMIPFFGWVVLGAEVCCIGWMLYQFAQPHELVLVSTYHFRGYELLDSNEWIVVILGFIGMGYLAWISIRAIKGKFVPVLMNDSIPS